MTQLPYCAHFSKVSLLTWFTELTIQLSLSSVRHVCARHSRTSRQSHHGRWRDARGKLSSFSENLKVFGALIEVYLFQFSNFHVTRIGHVKNVLQWYSTSVKLEAIPLHSVIFQHSCFPFIKHVHISALRFYVTSVQLYVISDLSQSYLLPLNMALLPVLQGHHEIRDNLRNNFCKVTWYS